MKQSKTEQEKLKHQPLKTTSELYKVIPTPAFLKDASALQKKYPTINKDFLVLAKALKDDPIKGNDHVFNDIWKVRMIISDKGKGERGAARVIIEIKIIAKEVFVLPVYDKGEIENLTEKELKKLMEAPKPIAKSKKSELEKKVNLKPPCK